MFPKLPDIRCAIPGRRGVSYKIPDMRCAIPGRQLLRHPGLVPGPWLAPGPIKKGRDSKTTLVGYFLDPEYRGAIPGRRMGISRSDFGTADGNIAERFRGDNLLVIPGSPRDLFKKAAI